MFERGFQDKHEHQSGGQGGGGGPRTVFERIAMILVLSALPFGIIWLFYFTTERGIPFYDKFNNWEWSKASQFDKSAHNASDAFRNVIELEAGLYQLEEAGKDLWGFTHSWQIPGYQLEWTLDDLEGRITHPNFSVSWEEKTNTNNVAVANEVLTNYAYLRAFYSRSKYVIDHHLMKSRNAAKGLPDDVTILRTLDNLRVYSNTQFAIQDIDRAKKLFASEIAPFFVEKKPPTSKKAPFFGILTLIAVTGAILFYLYNRRFQNRAVMNV